VQAPTERLLALACHARSCMLLLPLHRWELGVAACLFSQLLSSLGFTLQRRSHLNRLQELEALGEGKLGHDFSSPCTGRPLWTLGVTLYIMAALPDVLAYAFAPQIVLGPLGTIRTVLAALLAYMLLGERLHFQELCGMTLCTIGAAICLGFGPVGTGDTVDVTGNVYAYLLVSGGLLLGLTVWEHGFACTGVELSTVRRFLLPFITALAYCMEKIFNAELGALRSPEELREQPRWWGVLLGLVALGACDLHFNLRGAQRLPVQFFVPVYMAFGTIIQCFQGMVILNELAGLSILRIGASLLGALIALAGALLIRPPALTTAGMKLKCKQPKVQAAEPLLTE